MFRPQPIPAKAGQESVWDYPRPPRLEFVKLFMAHSRFSFKRTRRRLGL